ncbi:hypothetical protein BT96DRAFT_1022893 [Gymnopus androsaceus JB14]|uniref:F-box domain-containing protein n=1 Tax=Gymnopus androsaceus JB14 TaxID=1447944 RepID=A0A6A4H922_9AGAR|nr:hypothetical protein BT96DRAFT_1022893 [Gymnopus androsaceus JB14]
MLPLEIFLLIFALLDDDAQVSMAMLSMVCKAFNTIIEPQLYSLISLHRDEAVQSFNTTMATKSSDFLKTHVHGLILDAWSQVPNAELLSTTCPNISKFCFGGHLSHRLAGYRIQPEHISVVGVFNHRRSVFENFDESLPFIHSATHLYFPDRPVPLHPAFPKLTHLSVYYQHNLLDNARFSSLLRHILDQPCIQVVVIHVRGRVQLSEEDMYTVVQDVPECLDHRVVLWFGLVVRPNDNELFAGQRVYPGAFQERLRMSWEYDGDEIWKIAEDRIASRK